MHKLSIKKNDFDQGKKDNCQLKHGVFFKINETNMNMGKNKKIKKSKSAKRTSKKKKI